MAQAQELLMQEIGEDNRCGVRRSGVERRQDAVANFDGAEKRSGVERRSGKERRKEPRRRLS